MSDKDWAAIDNYISELLEATDPALETVLATSAKAGLPPINVTPNQGKFLYLMARMCQTRAILEIGTLGGYSTIWLARALVPGGKVITLEANPTHAQVAQSNITNAGLADVIELRLGQALDILPQLAVENRDPFDVIFIDADKANNANYFDWALKLSHPGSIIIVDNVVRAGTVLETASHDSAIQGTRRLFERVSTEPRVSATAIQTVGAKGHDGFLLAFVQA